MYFTIHCCHCISQNLCDCAWAVGDLGERAYLQDEVQCSITGSVPS